MNNYEIAVQKWQEQDIKTASDLERCLDSFRVLFAYNSGKIENSDITYHDTREIFENGKVVGYSGDTRTLFEQQNQKRCYDFLLDKIVAKVPLSVSLILEVHRILTEGTYDERRYFEQDERPGEFKKHDYVTGINEVGSEPSEVEQHIFELVEEVNSIGQKNPLLAGAYFHARFENIHPFADGNGRVGRTLLNYWLMINDYPPTIIFDDEKRAYYNALQQYDESENLSELVQVIQEQTIKTWDRVFGLTIAEQGQRKGLDLFLE